MAKQTTNAENANAPETIVSEPQDKITRPKKEQSFSFEDIMAKFESFEKKLAEKDAIIESQNEALSRINNGSASGISELIKTMAEERKRAGNVKVTYLGNDAQYMQRLSNGTIIKFTSYEQQGVISCDDAQRLINEYAESFRKGKLVFDADHLYLIEDKGIDITKINYHPMDAIKTINKLDNDGIRELYNSLTPYQRDMLKNYIFIEIKKNPDFISIDKVRYLNTLTLGGYKYLLGKLTELEDMKIQK